MQKKIQIKVPVADASNEQIIRNLLAKETGQPSGNITGFQLLKKSLDARSKYPHILITATVFINEPFRKHDSDQQPLRDVKQSAKSVLIIGAGPAGLFAALSLIRSGIRIKKGSSIPKVIIVLGKAELAPTVMVNFIPGVISGVISSVFSICLFDSARKKIFSTKPIPISAPINFRLSSARYAIILLHAEVK